METFENYPVRIHRNVWNDHSLFIKLVEKIGEVIQQKNIRERIKDSEGSNDKESAKEPADVAYYEVVTAAVNDIDIENTISQKDEKQPVNIITKLALKIIWKNKRKNR